MSQKRQQMSTMEIKTEKRPKGSVPNRALPFGVCETVDLNIIIMLDTKYVIFCFYHKIKKKEIREGKE